jgi:hypothetical protein
MALKWSLRLPEREEENSSVAMTSEDKYLPEKNQFLKLNMIKVFYLDY